MTPSAHSPHSVLQDHEILELSESTDPSVSVDYFSGDLQGAGSNHIGELLFGEPSTSGSFLGERRVAADHGAGDQPQSAAARLMRRHGAIEAVPAVDMPRVITLL